MKNKELFKDVKKENGKVSFYVKESDTFVVTGITIDGKRFSRQWSGNGGARQAMGINLWRGNVWLERQGKRKLLKSVYN